MTQIKIEGLDRVMKKVKTLEDMEKVKAGLQAGALHVKGKIAKYPPVKRLSRRQVYGAAFASDKQRRYFFAALRDGRIDVPYRRGQSSGSERHGQSWTIKSERGGLTWIVGSDTTYGPYLQDRERQSKYHQAVGWKTTDDVSEAESAKVSALVVKEIQRLLDA